MATARVTTADFKAPKHHAAGRTMDPFGTVAATGEIPRRKAVAVARRDVLQKLRRLSYPTNTCQLERS
jgi:hypothetical protein